MSQFIVLKPISPQQGPIIFPAEPTAAVPEPAPVLVDDTLFSGETDEERAANIARLIEQGVIASLPDPTPEPEPPAVPRRSRTAQE
jgi:hypothetical protein